MAVDDSGWVDFVFLDRRNDSANILCDAYFAQSRDGGKSFRNYRITPSSFDPRIAYNESARFGDWMGIDAAQGRSVPSWPDTRLGKQNVFVAAIDHDGSIRGSVFSDCDKDGNRLSSEKGLPG